MGPLVLRQSSGLYSTLCSLSLGDCALTSVQSGTLRMDVLPGVGWELFLVAGRFDGTCLLLSIPQQALEAYTK